MGGRVAGVDDAHHQHSLLRHPVIGVTEKPVAQGSFGIACRSHENQFADVHGDTETLAIPNVDFLPAAQQKPVLGRSKASLLTSVVNFRQEVDPDPTFLQSARLHTEDATCLHVLKRLRSITFTN